MMLTTLTTWRGLYIAPGPDAILRQQEEPFTWDIGPDYLRIPDGYYVAAEDGGGQVLRANRPERLGWETFTITKVGQGQRTFRSCGGYYVRAVDEGFDPSDAVRADALESGGWETFGVEEEADDLHPNPLGGRLACDGQRFHVEGRTVLPVAFHLGDGLSHAHHQGLQSLIDLALDPAAAAGYQIIRMWFSLGNKGNNDYWRGREFSPWVQGWTAWRDTIEDVMAACAERGLQLHLAGGDMEELSYDERTQLYNELGRQVREFEDEVGPTVALFEVLNECRNTGLEDPQELTRLRDIFRSHNPDTLTCLSAYSGTEEAEELRPYTPGSQPFVQAHTTRDGTVGDCARHAFSSKYDGYVKLLGRTLGWSTEPPGPGPRVSTISDQLKVDLRHEEGLLLLAGAQTAGGIYTMFCSDGVILDGCVDHWEGFYEIPQLVQWLEAVIPDVHQAHLTHVNDRKPDRVVDLPDNDTHIRCDQYILDGQRKALLVLYREDAASGTTRVTLDSLVGPARWSSFPIGDWGGYTSNVAVTFTYGTFIVMEW